MGEASLGPAALDFKPEVAEGEETESFKKADGVAWEACAGRLDPSAEAEGNEILSPGVLTTPLLTAFSWPFRTADTEGIDANK